MDFSGLDDETVEQVKDSPAAFVREVLNEEPYRYQERFLEAEEKNRVFVAGRQVGKSTTLSWYGVWKFATTPGVDVLYFAPSQRQAIELFDNKLKAVIDSWLKNPEQAGITYETKSKIHGVGNRRMVALTAAGASSKTVRGYTADCIIVDEAVFVEDDFFTSVLAPMTLTTDGEFILAGTPWGQSGFFYNKYNADRWFQIQVSSYENPDIPAHKIEEWKESMSSSEFKREVLGEFVPGKNAAFPPDVIKQCKFASEEDLREYPLYDGPPCYLGVDPARAGTDQAVLVSIDEEGNVFDVIVEEECKLSHLEGMIRNLNDRRGYRRVMIDETGLGGGPLDNLKEDLRHVEGFTFSLQSKQELYQTLLKHLEDEAITLPDVRWMLGELRDIQYEMTPRGRHKYFPGDEGTDDFVDALALAVWAKKDGGGWAGRQGKAYTFGGGSDDDGGDGPSAYSFGS